MQEFRGPALRARSTRLAAGIVLLAASCVPWPRHFAARAPDGRTVGCP